MNLQRRLVTVLDEILTIQEEDDGAVTVRHDDTFASLRVVAIAEGLEMVSLTQILAWDLPLDSKIRARVAQHAHDTLLGTVSLVEKNVAAKRNSKKTADVMLRYNFPAAGLTDEALSTLIPDGAVHRNRCTPGLSLNPWISDFECLLGFRWGAAGWMWWRAWVICWPGPAFLGVPWVGPGMAGWTEAGRWVRRREVAWSGSR